MRESFFVLRGCVKAEAWRSWRSQANNSPIYEGLGKKKLDVVVRRVLIVLGSNKIFIRFWRTHETDFIL